MPSTSFSSTKSVVLRLILGTFRQHSEFITYHKFVFRIISFYTHMNMFLVPLLGLGYEDATDIIEGFFTWKKVRNEFVFGSGGRII